MGYVALPTYVSPCLCVLVAFATYLVEIATVTRVH